MAATGFCFGCAPAARTLSRIAHCGTLLQASGGLAPMGRTLLSGVRSFRVSSLARASGSSRRRSNVAFAMVPAQGA